MKNTDPTRLVRAALQNAKNIDAIGAAYVFTFSGRTEHFSQSELSAVDARLPVVIDYLLENHPKRVPEVVRQTMSHWADPQPPQEGIVNSHLDHPTYIQFTYDEYYIKANRYKVETLAGGVEVAYPTNKNVGCMVSEEWLNRYYPKAAIKVKILQDMGMDTEEISKLALAEIEADPNPVDISGIAFT